MQKSIFARLWDILARYRLWRSIFRHGFPDNPKDQSLIAYSHFITHIHPVKTKRASTRITYTFGLGGLSLACFLILVVTGLLLMFYYVPSTARAYDDMIVLRNEVAFGWFFRNLHRWAAHAMVIFVFLHMLRVYYTASYKEGREFNWVIGVFLFLTTLFLSFTGYLLPWDQLAYWAINVGANLAGYAPLIGDRLKFLLLGDYTIGQNTLIRFYTLHVFALPALAVFLMAIHFWRVRKDGISLPPAAAAGDSLEESQARGAVARLTVEGR